MPMDSPAPPAPRPNPSHFPPRHCAPRVGVCPPPPPLARLCCLLSAATPAPGLQRHPGCEPGHSPLLVTHSWGCYWPPLSKRQTLGHVTTGEWPLGAPCPGPDAQTEISQALSRLRITPCLWFKVKGPRTAAHVQSPPGAPEDPGRLAISRAT